MRAEPEDLQSAARRGPRVYVSPVGSHRLEVAYAVGVSIFGGLFTLQSLPSLVAQWEFMATPLGMSLVVFVYGSVALAVVAAMLRRWWRAVFIGAAVGYLVAVALWPLALVPGADMHGQIPWLSVLGTLASAFLTAARRDWIVPLMYAALTCVLIGFVRASPSGGDATAGRAVLDAVYTFALDIAIIVLVTAGRQAARSVDTAQNNALQRYAMVQIDEATERQRVQTDALVHDSVLTTFISASKAETPDAEALAARMARNSMAHLDAARAVVVSDDDPVPLPELVSRIRQEAGEVARLFSVQTATTEGHRVPGAVATAIVFAATQAMVNSANHAGEGAIGRSLRVQGTENGVSVTVSDRGKGFDLAAIPAERLGVRISMMQRMRSAGGDATLTTAPGRGTRVVFSWPSRAVDESAARTAETAGVL